MFATGVENSAPTIDGGRTRADEMASCGHYDRWQEDFALVEQMGIGDLRYGRPLHMSWLGVGRYDWEIADRTFAELKRRAIVPIVDLCHFGVPDWVGNFQNPDFAEYFCGYARAFAERFPWVQLYTPVNEMYICATLSARYGWWNEELSSDRAFVTALKHIIKANATCRSSSPARMTIGIPQRRWPARMRWPRGPRPNPPGRKSSMGPRFQNKVAVVTGAAEDVAAAVAFLASDDATFITGASLAVDGGRLAKL